MEKKDIYTTEGKKSFFKAYCDVFDEFCIGLLNDLIKAYPFPSLYMEDDKDEQ